MGGVYPIHDTSCWQCKRACGCEKSDDRVEYHKLIPYHARSAGYRFALTEIARLIDEYERISAQLECLLHEAEQ